MIGLRPVAFTTILSLALGCAAFEQTQLDLIRDYGIQYTSKQAPPKVLAYLVEHLDHDDSAVRMMAVIALEKITNQRKGYDPYADRNRRQESIRRWVQAIRSGEMDQAMRPAGKTLFRKEKPDGTRRDRDPNHE